MQVVVLAALVLSFTMLEIPPPPWASPWVFLPALGLYLAGAVALGLVSSSLGIVHLRARVAGTSAPARPHRIATLSVRIWLVLGSAGVIALGYGRWIIDQAEIITPWGPVPVAHVPLLVPTLALSPFLLAVLVTWLLEYPYHRLLRQEVARAELAAGRQPPPIWSWKQFLVFNLRHHLLFVLAPVACILLLRDLLAMIDRWGAFPDTPWGDAMFLGGMLASAGVVFVLAPLMIVRIWKTRPLPEGPLRRRLRGMCERLSMGYRDILVWDSGGVLANAGAMGLVGPVRFVLLSDALLDRMDPSRIEAIFAHEAGHIVHHHIFYSGLFAIASVLLCTFAGDTVGRWTGGDLWTMNTVTVGLLVAVWGVGFGWISRRFERQSDVVAAWTMSREQAGEDLGGRVTPQGAHVFASALEYVASLNGMGYGRFNWRHGAIRWRVNYILSLSARAGSRSEIDRLVRTIKVGLWVSTAFAVGALGWMIYRDGLAEKHEGNHEMTDANVAIVTGASSGIGAHTAVELARRGMQVTLAARREDRLREIARRCREVGPEATVHPTDVSDEQQVQRLVDVTVDRHGRLDVMVNNAGIGHFGRVHETSTDDMRRVLDINYFGLFWGARAAGEVMARQKRGHIFNVSSVIGKRGTPFHGAYCATKFAIVGLSDSMRVELRPYDVNVTCVCPGLTQTEFFDDEQLEDPGRSKYVRFRTMMHPRVVGRRIARTVGCNKPELVFTAGGRFLAKVGPLWPRLGDWIMKFYHDDLAGRRS